MSETVIKMKLRLIGGDVTCFSHRGRCRQLTVSFVCQATEMALTEGTVNSAASPPAASGETCVSMHFVAAWFYRLKHTVGQKFRVLGHI